MPLIVAAAALDGRRPDPMAPATSDQQGGDRPKNHHSTRQLAEPGARWKLNLYRCDRANNAFVAWNPTLRGSFHTPERFGVLVFEGTTTR